MTGSPSKNQNDLSGKPKTAGSRYRIPGRIQGIASRSRLVVDVSRYTVNRKQPLSPRDNGCHFSGRHDLNVRPLRPKRCHQHDAIGANTLGIKVNVDPWNFNGLQQCSLLCGQNADSRRIRVHCPIANGQSRTVGITERPTSGRPAFLLSRSSAVSALRQLQTLQL